MFSYFICNKYLWSKGLFTKKDFFKCLVQGLNRGQFWIIVIKSIIFIITFSECCDDAVEIFNKNSLIQVIINHIEPRWGLAMCMACADCLLCVSEDNRGLNDVKERLCEMIQSLLNNCRFDLDYLRYLTTLSGELVYLC